MAGVDWKHFERDFAKALPSAKREIRSSPASLGRPFP
jgi:hypothetical protein